MIREIMEMAGDQYDAASADDALTRAELWCWNATKKQQIAWYSEFQRSIRQDDDDLINPVDGMLVDDWHERVTRARAVAILWGRA